MLRRGPITAYAGMTGTWSTSSAKMSLSARSCSGSGRYPTPAQNSLTTGPSVRSYGGAQ
jgi:hypothetical protein